MRPAIGMPIAAFGSVPEITLTRSPSRFIESTIIAIARPHPAPRHRPRAAREQAVLTNKNKITAQRPIAPKPARPREFSRHNGSRKPPGNSRENEATRVMAVATIKKILSAVMPAGRVFSRDLIKLPAYLIFTNCRERLNPSKRGGG